MTKTKANTIKNRKHSIQIINLHVL